MSSFLNLYNYLSQTDELFFPPVGKNIFLSAVQLFSIIASQHVLFSFLDGSDANISKSPQYNYLEL